MILEGISKLLVVLLIINLFLTSCKEKQKNSVENFTTKKIIEQNSALNTDFLVYSKKDQFPSDTIKHIMKGRLTLGHELSRFSPCGDTNEFWILAEDELYNLYFNLTKNKKPYTPIFVRIEVIDKGKSEDGFAADYKSTYEVKTIVEARSISDIDCD
ncbi:hypothetical protein [Cellulophaga sp. HaHa_2_1]|uniref:hypothetical protein n=1 Tax=Cellulophaga sp. HaHa_2_1 TaxID=2749994 RepID=UPI001C4F26C6|nr:hypothetical protein [Cellulophaga sp. HaHa_2_1]QXP52850.1 hypothetical protein H0I24_02685 [Cellulophaga sp. HaHa_2_1]